MRRSTAGGRSCAAVAVATAAAAPRWRRPLVHGLLLLLLLPALAAALCPQASLPARLPRQCASLPRVCVDQRVFVLYANQHNPRHEQFAGLPRVALANISIDYYGYGDEWGTAFAPPQPRIRPATAGEETRELAHPQFSQCTLPVVLYAHRLYSFADFFINTAAAVHMLQVAHTFDKRLTFVVDTFGMQLEPFHRFLLAPFTRHRVTTLSHLSSRMPPAQEEGYNPDGNHVRCFRQLLLCQMQGGGAAAAAALAQAAPLPHPLWATGQAVFHFYKHRLPAIDPSFADATKLKVLIAALPRRNKIRAIVNQEQVWSWCNKFQPPAGVQHWNGTACLLHEFGRNLLSDLAYTRQADVLIGLHSDSLANAFFMAQHASVVEVRPRGFSGQAASQHMKGVTAADGHSILWWGIKIVDPTHSAPGLLETQQRGQASIWPRERHVFMRLMACQYVLERVALTRGNADTYHSFVARGEHFITDTLQPASDDEPAAAPAAVAQQAPPPRQQQQQQPDLLAAATAAAAAAGAAGR